jgi:hypothetical protein
MYRCQESKGECIRTAHTGNPPICIHPPIHQSMHPCIHPSSYPPTHQATHPPIHASMHPCIHASIHPSMHASIYQCIHPPTIHSSIHPSIHPFTHTYIHTCIHLLICASFTHIMHILLISGIRVLEYLFGKANWGHARVDIKTLLFEGCLPDFNKLTQVRTIYSFVYIPGCK